MIQDMNVKIFFICSCILCTLSSCTKNSDTSAITFPKATTGVFIAGTSGRASLWKDASVYTLDIPNIGGNSSEANSVFVADTVVYVTGSSYCSCGPRAARVTSDSGILWKNGVATKLPGYFGQVIAYNNDVYVMGNNLSGQPTYWKNGIPVIVDRAYNTTATSIFVSGNDVYETGFETDTISAYITDIAVYWKNGTRIKLSTTNSWANSIFVSGTDVYVVGFDIGTYAPGKQDIVPVLWKNGVKTNLPLNLPATTLVSGVKGATKVVVSGTDVYVIGEIYINSDFSVTGLGNGYYSYCWKNNAIDFSIPPTNGGDSFFWDLFVKGTDEYILGTSKYWKNHVPVLFKGLDAKSIFVK